MDEKEEKNENTNPSDINSQKGEEENLPENNDTEEKFEAELDWMEKLLDKGGIKKKKEIFIYIIDIIFNGIVIFGLVFLIRHFLISPFQVSGQSMCNTLNYVNNVCLGQSDMGEYIIVNKLSYRFETPGRGDIIVFTPPIKNEEFYVKRIIGLPGEKVQIRKDGNIWIKEKEETSWEILDEPYLNEQNQGRTFIESSLTNYIFEIPEGKYFVLGDNRNGSSDSRHWKDIKTGEPMPFVNKESIDGKVWVVLWPFTNIRMVEQDVGY